jgi:putative ABC transport system permease protein
MDLREMLRIGVKSLTRHKLRTLLTMLGVIFGVAAVVAMMSISEGARRQALEQIRLLGTNNIRIRAIEASGAEEEEEFRNSPGLTATDAERVRSRLPTARAVSALRFVDAPVSRGGEQPQGVNVVGVSDEYDDLTNVRPRSGRFISWIDMRSVRRVCVLGAEIRRELFGTEDPLGQEVRIGETRFRVIGVMGAKNVRQEGPRVIEVRNLDRDIYIPLATALRRFPTSDEMDQVDEIAVQVSHASQVLPSSRVVRRILEPAHRGVEDYQVVVPTELLAQSQRTQRIFNVVMGSIAALSLLVGGIGIMNIMLATVTERTKEIGIRRAIGASERHILVQFLHETLLLSVSGGIIGIILGALMALGIHLFAEWKTVLSPLAIVISFVIAASVGVVFGLYPARQAARKDPIEALRYE